MQRRDREPFGGLTARERDIIELLREGRSDLEIAERLEISPASATYQVTQLMRKLGASSREDAVRLGALSPAERFLQAQVGQEGGPSGLRLSVPRLTPLRAVIGVIVLAIAGLYGWGLLSGGGGSDDAAVQVRWLQADPPAPDFVELERPFQSLANAGLEDVWRVFVVESSGASRQLLESRRALHGVRWSSDGSRLNLQFSSQASDGQAVLGVLTMNATTGEVEHERGFPARSMGLVAPDGRIALVDSAPDRRGQALYVLEADGRSIRLDASWDRVQPHSWSADGRLLLVESLVRTESGPSEEVYFILEPGVERAVRLGAFEVAPTWSPDGKLLAGYSAGRLIVVNSEGGEAHNIDLRRGPTNVLAPEFFLSSRMWSGDGRFLAFGGAVVDTSNGRLLSQPDPDLGFTTVSPDGRYVVALSSASACREPDTVARPRGQANRLLIREVGGEETVLLDCALGFHTFLGWITPTSMLVGSNVCVGDCSATNFTLNIASVPDGRLTRLGQSQGGMTFAISADGQRILTGSNDVKLYTRDGNLLRTLPITGGQVTDLAWSPDGDSFMYVAGPPVRNLNMARP